MEVFKPTINIDRGNSNDKWHSLYLLNLYRFAIATIFLSITTLDKSPSVFGRHDPELFFLVSSAYLLMSICCAFEIRWRYPKFNFQVYLQIALDILIIVLLMHASGSIQSGLGTLLIVTIAGASNLIEKRSSILFAAIATIAILLEQSYIVLYTIPIDINFSQAGVLGTALFATAFITHFLNKRIQESEALAQQRGIDLEKMEVLADYIVQRMQTGIVVIDQDQRIRLINDSACQLLNIDSIKNYPKLDDLSSELFNELKRSQLHHHYESKIIRPTKTSAEVTPRFASLGDHQRGGTLIFLEDTAQLSQQAQQLKLASLGRLTASIAHEIRNPLGAISHAGQLLAESEHIDHGERRMVQIIVDHSKRMNTIIENVLQLSRRQASQPLDIQLESWLNNFIDEFQQINHLNPHYVELDTQQDIKIVFDPTQLQQILWNICSNAMRYTQVQKNDIGLTLKTYYKDNSNAAVLDIIDYGTGITDEESEHIFEPFFTTETKGTGLGLYIARELCESNQARLSYLRTDQNSSCFRITFADTRRIRAIDND